MPTLVRLKSPDLAVEVSSMGAEMQSLTSSDGRAWLWNGDPQFWTGRSPILFPIVGKAPDDKLEISGTQYDMAQHGFARRAEFELGEANDSSCRHILIASESTKRVFPFDFSLEVSHVLAGATLTVTASVANRGGCPMLFGIGFHPAFRWPLPSAAGKQHFISLANGAEPPMRRVEGGLMRPDKFPSPFCSGRLVLDHAMFDDDAMIFPEGAGSTLVYAAESGPILRFSSVNLPNLALWSKPAAPFLCIEPWHGTAPEIGASAELASRPHTVTLLPGASEQFGFTVDLTKAL